MKMRAATIPTTAAPAAYAVVTEVAEKKRLLLLHFVSNAPHHL